MKYCNSCGAQVADGVKFCPKCGKPVESTANNAGSQSMNSQSMGQQQYQHQGQSVGNGFQQPFMNSGICPKTWMVESILVTLFCCFPFGIVGIINASKVNSQFIIGNIAGAEQASNDAGKWTKIGFFVGIAGWILYAIFYAFVFALAS